MDDNELDIDSGGPEDDFDANFTRSFWLVAEQGSRIRRASASDLEEQGVLICATS